MKYVLAWTARLTGSATENEAAVRRGVELFSKWQPPAGMTIHQFVGRVDGAGGFAVVETDSAADLLDGSAKFGAMDEFQIYPVIDVNEWMQAVQEGVEFRESIT